ncbi:MAG: signal recognition particle-docking protein FtsY [Gammaproteobacteria bacterium]|nr:signal recognition particle-docking protein FtsY [Gammaproteobacteria bacterium]
MKLFRRKKTDKKTDELIRGLTRTRSRVTDGLSSLVLGKKTIDDNLLEEIETRLLSADLGISTTTKIIDYLTQTLRRKELSDPQILIQTLKQILTDILTPCSLPLTIDEKKQPYVILMVGINGAGKTTTIGKLAKQMQHEGKTVMLAAGDTYRAAAIDQLKVWGGRNGIPVISQPPGADTASVIYDAMQAAKARNVDVLIADTAGRLHTQDHLMAELAKIIRVIKKTDESAPHEVMLVLDASIGQNALQQAKHFSATAQVTGITMTKLDGSAKGGIIFAVADEFALPIRYIGIGEGIDDLQPFVANAFVDALFVEQQ